ncbi:MAG: 30S ribosomal protein S2 [bacterium]|nr:30S ribosomal protein S2 [bacterium]
MATELKETPNVSGQKTDPVLDEMSKAGLQFGHKTSKTHPKMKLYIAGIRNTVHIFNLEKTKEKLDEALVFVKELRKEGKVLLLVGTKVQIRNLVKSAAEECDIPYVVERWIGGTLTNFETIQKRVTYMKELEEKKQSGELEKYTKKEQMQFNKEIMDLEKKYGGVRNLPRLPDAVFILDLDENNLALREAVKKEIKIVALCDTNINPALVDYPIPANDDAVSSVGYILGKLGEAIKDVKAPATEEKKEDGSNA